MADSYSTPKAPAKSPINIKPAHEGKFTKWATAHGFKSAGEAATAVMANPSKYPEAVVKMANFAKNFGKSKPAMGKLLGH